MVVQLRRTLTENIRDAAEITATSIADTIAQDELRHVIPGGEDDEFVQVIDPEDGVVASTANLPDPTPVVDIQPQQMMQVDGLPFGEGWPFVVVAEDAESRSGAQLVVVGRTLEPVAESTGLVIGSVAVGIPILMLVVAAVTWVVVGRALARSRRSGARCRPSPVTASTDGAGAAGRRRDRPPGDHDEHDARSSRGGTGSPAASRLRRLARAQVTDRGDPPTRRGRPGPSRGVRRPELAEVVLAEDLRLQRMVEDLLLLTKIDEGTLALRRSQVDLDDIVLAEATRLRAADTGIRVDTRAVSACRVLGDEAHLERLVRTSPTTRSGMRGERSRCRSTRSVTTRCYDRRRRLRRPDARPGTYLRAVREAGRGARSRLGRHRPRLGDRPRDRQRASRHGHGIGRSDRGRSVRGDDPA